MISNSPSETTRKGSGAARGLSKGYIEREAVSVSEFLEDFDNEEATIKSIQSDKARSGSGNGSGSARNNDDSLQADVQNKVNNYNPSNHIGVGVVSNVVGNNATTMEDMNAYKDFMDDFEEIVEGDS